MTRAELEALIQGAISLAAGFASAGLAGFVKMLPDGDRARFDAYRVAMVAEIRIGLEHALRDLLTPIAAVDARGPAPVAVIHDKEK